jgi:hypothetical protein
MSTPTVERSADNGLVPAGPPLQVISDCRSEAGQVAAAPFAPLYGMVTDRFGVTWIVGVEAAQE